MIFKCLKANPNWTQKHRNYAQILQSETQRSFHDSIIYSNEDLFKKIHTLVQNGLIDKSIYKPQYVDINALHYATRQPNANILGVILALKDDKGAPLYDRSEHIRGIKNIISSTDPITHLSQFKETLDSLTENELQHIFEHILRQEKSTAKSLCEQDWIKKWIDNKDFLKKFYKTLQDEAEKEDQRIGKSYSGRSMLVEDNICQQQLKIFKEIFFKEKPAPVVNDDQQPVIEWS